MPVPDGELHRVLFVDGIWLAERLVVLICCSEDRVVSWYMAQSGNSRAWSALMDPIPAPDVVVTDGGSGFAKAVRATWPRTKVQRCVFHAFCQVKRCTTTRPKLQAGRELYGIALDLMHIETLHQAELWRERYLDWCGFWADFLEDTTLVDGRRVYTHERLRKARRSLSSLVSAGTLFTYLDPGLTKAGPLPYTNNKIEGGVNAQLRAVLRNHRGLTTLKRVKAVFWWCHAHSGDARTAREKLATMPRTPTSTCSTTSIRHPGSTTTGGRNGAIGLSGKSSIARIPSRSGWISMRGTCVLSRHTFCPISPNLTIENYKQDALEWDDGAGGYNVNIEGSSTYTSGHCCSGFTGTFIVTVDNPTVTANNNALTDIIFAGKGEFKSANVQISGT